MATNFKLKRSAVASKRPGTTDLELGELALNTYDGFLYSERTGDGAGVSLLTPWREKIGEDIISYTGAVGIGSTDPEGKLDVIGNVNIVVPTTSNYQSLLLLGNDSNQAGLTADLDFQLKNGKARITTGTPTSLVLGTQGSESIHIDTMGRVGIGTTHPKIEPGGLYVDRGVNVAGLSTFHDDVNFIGATGISSITFDKSENEFKLLDYSKLVLGEGGDATIQHDSFRTIIRQHGTGPFVLDLLGNNKSFEITKSNLSETLAKFNTNGSVDLFYAGGIRFGTTGYGVTVYGEAQFTGLSTFLSGASLLDNDVLYFGGSYSTGISTDHRLRIYSDGTDSYISEATGAGHLILSSDSRVEIKNAALNHTVASFNTGIGVTVNDRFKVVGIATLGSGASGQVILQHGGLTKFQTQTWGVRGQGTIQTIGGRIETAHTGSQTEGYSVKLLNSNGAGGVKDLIEIGHTSNNSFITGHVGKININAPVVSISTHFSVGGISTFTGNITANSNIGIGTDSPTARLHISGPDAASAMIKIEDNNNNIAASQILVQNGGRDLRISAPNDIIFTKLTSGTPLLYLENGNAVGIGTDNPGATLDVFGNTKLRNDLDVDGISTLGNIGISTGRITGPAITYIDPAAVGDDTGTLVVKGNLQVEGTQTTVNSSTMTVTDKNIELAKGAANDAAADGGGITVDSGNGDKTWQWLDATDSWTSSEHIRIPDDKAFGFATDTNTFISRPVADTITFTHGGSEKVRITSDGEVGIGTTNPGRGSLDAKLHVSSTDLNTVIIERSPNSDADPYGSRIAFIDALTSPGQGAYIQGYNGAIELGTSNGPKFVTSDANDGRVGINTDDLDVMGFYVLDVDGSTRIKGNVVSTGSSTTGISTVVGVGTFKDDVYIDKKLYVGGIEIGGPGGPGIGTDITTRHLTVTGFSTFTGAIDANGDLDVDGHTNLDNVNVSGVSTFTNEIVIRDDSPTITFDQTSGALNTNQYRIREASGELVVQVSHNNGASYTNGVSIGGIGNIFIPDNDKVFFGTDDDAYIQHDNSNLNIINTTGNIDVTGDVVLNNDLNVTGVSTFVSFLDVNDTTQSSDKDTGSIITEGGVGIEKNLNVGGIINSSTDVQINGTSVVDSALNDAVAMAIALG